MAGCVSLPAWPMLPLKNTKVIYHNHRKDFKIETHKMVTEERQQAKNYKEAILKQFSDSIAIESEIIKQRNGWKAGGSFSAQNSVVVFKIQKPKSVPSLKGIDHVKMYYDKDARTRDYFKIGRNMTLYYTAQGEHIICLPTEYIQD